MAEITDYVDLTIVLADAAITIPSFGSMCVVGTSPAGDAGLHTIAATPTGLQAYTEELSGVITDAAYKMLGSCIAQTPHTAELYWYNPKNTPTTSLEMTPSGPFTEGKSYTMFCNSVELEHVCTASADATEVATGLNDQAALVVGVTAVDNTGSFNLTTFDSSYTSVFLKNFKSLDLGCEVASSSAGDVTDDLNNALLANSDMYGFVLDLDNDTDLAAAAAWAEVNRRWLILRTKDQDVLAGAGVLDTLHAAGYHRTMLIFSEDDDGRADCALMGRQLALDPGSSDLQFKRLAGVTRSQLSAGQITAIKAKNGATYTVTSGVAMTDGGVAVSGRPMAVTRNVDWLDARIKQEIMITFANNEIVILGEPGIAKMEKAIRTVLEEAEDATVILPGWSLQVPSAADITSADKSEGLLAGFNFAAETAVGTRKVKINGVLS